MQSTFVLLGFSGKRGVKDLRIVSCRYCGFWGQGAVVVVMRTYHIMLWLIMPLSWLCHILYCYLGYTAWLAEFFYFALRIFTLCCVLSFVQH